MATQAVQIICEQLPEWPYPDRLWQVMMCMNDRFARGRIQRKTWCMRPYAGVDYNLTLCPLQHTYHGQPNARVEVNPIPESTLSPSQWLRILPQIQDKLWCLNPDWLGLRQITTMYSMWLPDWPGPKMIPDPWLVPPCPSLRASSLQMTNITITCPHV